ncbi:general transcription factor iiic polypeptide 5 [Holotrichia oblita]|uniref:General transcription factor iiic polypeptide 5 n=1 Tax=Holotrichia oblita TaxID=644536 RepID=A0ACB9THA1_HOLOL|nr:general transcription factor iiic polypeptide 5 [Holotrichia oblita]
MEKSDEVAVDKSTIHTTHEFHTKLVCIDYPGIVNNVDKMIESLGGMTEIERNISTKRKMLNLKFRPGDKYSKPTWSDLDKKPGILVKLTPKESTDAAEQDYNYEVVGITALTYSFNKLCDFQYLPLIAKEDENSESPLTYVYDKIIPNDIPKEKEWLFAPPKLALQFLNLRCTTTGAYEKIKSLFEKRPIWSRAAILYFSEVPKEQLKFILPAVAFHFHNGPWRIMWCKYGYDPRKDPSSRIYQTFDFRVRATAGLKAKVRTKRQYNLQRYRQRVTANTPKVSLNEVVENAANDADNEAVSESAFMLKPGVMPPARQTFYQYCDVHLPEIQTMLNRLPPIMPGTDCDFKNGWLPNKFTDQCRDIVNKYMIEQVQKANQEENRRLMEEQGQGDSVSVAASSTEEQKEQDFLEISDSDSDSDSEYLPSDLSDNDEDYNDTSANSKKTYKKKTEPSSAEIDAEDDDDEIDMEAVDDVNKLLQSNYAALKDFDRLVYDSD